MREQAVLEDTEQGGACQIRLNEVLEAFPHAAMIVEKDYRIVAANQRFRRRYSVNGVCGRRCHQVLHRSEIPNCGEGVGCPLTQDPETLRRVRFVHHHQTVDGVACDHMEVFPVARSGSLRGGRLFVIRSLDEPG